MSLNETKTYTVEIILSTERGELPTDEEVERLINDQMSGELDETTGLGCMAVSLNVDTLLEGAFEDVKSSYRLALEQAGVAADVISGVEQTVTDYVTNHWF